MGIGAARVRGFPCMVNSLLTTDELSVFTEHPVDIPEPTDLNQGGQDLYFEVLELQPTELSLSFMRSAHTNAEEDEK
jgi:vacuolar protein sorting-associated protein 13A/C